MRLAWFIGSLTLLVSTTGCCCGSCGWGGRGVPPTYQASTPQYGTAGTYASTPPGAAMGSTSLADGSMTPPGGAASGAPLPSGRSTMTGSNVETASHEMPAVQ